MYLDTRSNEFNVVLHELTRSTQGVEKSPIKEVPNEKQWNFYWSTEESFWEGSNKIFADSIKPVFSNLANNPKFQFPHLISKSQYLSNELVIDQNPQNYSHVHKVLKWVLDPRGEAEFRKIQLSEREISSMKNKKYFYGSRSQFIMNIAETLPYRAHTLVYGEDEIGLRIFFSNKEFGLSMEFKNLNELSENSSGSYENIIVINSLAKLSNEQEIRSSLAKILNQLKYNSVLTLIEPIRQPLPTSLETKLMVDALNFVNQGQPVNEFELGIYLFSDLESYRHQQKSLLTAQLIRDSIKESHGLESTQFDYYYADEGVSIFRIFNR